MRIELLGLCGLGIMVCDLHCTGGGTLIAHSYRDIAGQFIDVFSSLIVTHDIHCGITFSSHERPEKTIRSMYLEVVVTSLKISQPP